MRYISDRFWKKFLNIQEKDLTGIETPNITSDTKVKSLINLNGQYITDAQRGITIEKMSNGTTKKVLMR